MAEASTLTGKENNQRLFWIAAATIFLISILSLVYFLPLAEQYYIHIIALSVGLPFALLILSNRTRRMALVLLLALVPFVGILKAITTSRYAPLTFDLAIAAGCSFSILVIFLKGRLRLAYVDLLILLFIFMAFVAMFHPNIPSLAAGLEGFRKFAFAAIAFFIGRHLFTQRHLRIFQQVTLWASFLIALYGIKQFFYMSALDWRLVDLASAGETTYTMGGHIRPFSTLPGPFHLGLYMVVSALLVSSQMYAFRQNPKRWLWLIVILAVEILALFLTRTKANWLGLVAGIAMLFVFLSGFGIKTILRLSGIALIGLILIVVLLRFSSGGESKVLLEAIDAIENPAEAPTFQFRLQLWEERILPAIEKHPYLGWGTGSAGEGLGFYFTGTPYQYFPSHSLYLKILLELGVFGLLLFLAIIAISLWTGWRNYRWLHRHRHPLMQHHLWALAVICAILVTGITGPMLDAYPVNYFFWLLLGSITAPLARITQ